MTDSTKKQSEYAVQLSRKLLKPIGLWPIAPGAPRSIKLINMLLVVASFSLILFILVPCALHTFLEEPNMAIRMKLIGPMSFAVMALAKYISLTQRTAEIDECFRHVEEDWRNSCEAERKRMYKHAKVGRSLSIFSAIFMYGGGIFYHGIMPLAAVQTFLANVDDQNSIDHFTNESTDMFYEAPKRPRILTFPTYNAWLNIEVSIIFESVYVLQCLSGYVLDTITVGTCSLAAVFVTHTCAQLELIIQLISRYIDGDTGDEDVPFPSNAKTREDRLAVIVDRHMRALKGQSLRNRRWIPELCWRQGHEVQWLSLTRILTIFRQAPFGGIPPHLRHPIKTRKIHPYHSRVETNLNGICFVEFIGCTMNICFIGYYCLTEWERKEPISTATYFILLTSFTINIFIFCYIGELLTEQCTRIGSIYHIIDWYDLPGKKASDLFFIIAISRYPTKLTAGKFVDLTLITFSNVMKSAFTYFNLIRTVM